jgi:hypothetical protein
MALPLPLMPELIAFLALAGSTESEFRLLPLVDKTAVLANFYKFGNFFHSLFSSRINLLTL